MIVDYHKLNQIKAPIAGALPDVTKFQIKTEPETALCQAILELETKEKSEILIL